jgi:hypothetical protein
MSAAFAAALALVGLGVVALCVVVVRRNRALRRRPSNIPVHARLPDEERWCPGHGVWANDVFAFRRSPAAWDESLLWVAHASARGATENERTRLPAMGDDPVVATFVLASGSSMAFAARREHRTALLGPFA